MLAARAVCQRFPQPAKAVNASAALRTSRITSPRVTIPLDCRRYISAYGYTQAKALVYSKYGEPSDVLRVHKHSISLPHGSLATIKMLAAPMNPADINQIQGVYPSKPPMDITLGTPEPSAVGGNEGVGLVTAVGSACKTLAVGDWVIMKHTSQGTWRTHLQIDESKLLKITSEEREGLSVKQVGTIAVNPITAYRMLTDFTSWNWGQPEWFIQNGANSGVGRAAIQLGREWGLKSLNVIRERPGWEDMKSELESLGATAVITDTQLLSKGISATIKELTSNGREPIRLALNCVGGKNATALAKLLAPDSHHVTYGAMAKEPVMLPAGLQIFKNLVFDGFWVSRWGDRNPEAKLQTVRDVMRLMRAGRFTDGPTEEVRWEEDTNQDELVKAVQGTLGGYRSGKGVFVFGEM